MSWFSRLLLFAGAPACLAVLLVTPPAGAQSGNGQKVTFSTADGVDLEGTWYPGTKRNAPVVILLHSLGENRSKKEWQNLADALQQSKEGYAVLAFDFRGHGGSTSFSPQLFGSGAAAPGLPSPALYNRNANLARGDASLDFQKFSPTYYPTLVNDIAAARAFLDLKNDAGECNTSSIILIGAETGATLGAIWLNSEWHRFQYQPPNGFQPGLVNYKHPAGKDVIGAVWLSMAPKLGKKTCQLTQVLRKAAYDNQTPMAFVYNADDATDKAVAETLEQKLKPAKMQAFQKLTAAVPIEKAQKLKGRELLQPTLGTVDSLIAYLREVTQEKGNPWINQDFIRTQYVWTDPYTNQPSQANGPGERTFYFQSFERYSLLR